MLTYPGVLAISPPPPLLASGSPSLGYCVFTGNGCRLLRAKKGNMVGHRAATLSGDPDRTGIFFSRRQQNPRQAQVSTETMISVPWKDDFQAGFPTKENEQTGRNDRIGGK